MTATLMSCLTVFSAIDFSGQLDHTQVMRIMMSSVGEELGTQTEYNLSLFPGTFPCG